MPEHSRRYTLDQKNQARVPLHLPPKVGPSIFPADRAHEMNTDSLKCRLSSVSDLKDSSGPVRRDNGRPKGQRSSGQSLASLKSNVLPKAEKTSSPTHSDGTKSVKNPGQVFFRPKPDVPTKLDQTPEHTRRDSKIKVRIVRADSSQQKNMIRIPLKFNTLPKVERQASLPGNQPQEPLVRARLKVRVPLKVKEQLLLHKPDQLETE